MEVTKGIDFLVINGEKNTNRRSVIGVVRQGPWVFGPVVGPNILVHYETQIRFVVHFEKNLAI